MRGKRIGNLKGLMAAVHNHKAVICSSLCFARPRPAAFMIHLSGSMLVSLFASGMWLYRSKKSKDQ